MAFTQIFGLPPRISKRFSISITIFSNKIPFLLSGIFPRYLRRLHWGTLGCFLLVLLFFKPPTSSLPPAKENNKPDSPDPTPNSKWMKFQKRHQPSTTTTSSTTSSAGLLTPKESTSPKKEVSKVEKILKGSLDSIPSPSPSVKIQIMGGKVCLRCKGKTQYIPKKQVLVRS